MLLTDCGPRVVEADVDAFERRVGVALPVGYRRFLVEVNGGYGPMDPEGMPPDEYHSLHWLGGPVADADLEAVDRDPAGSWGLGYYRDLEFMARSLWRNGLSRDWLPVGGTGSEDLLLIRLADGSVWQMDMLRGGFDDDECTRVAGSFEELGLRRA